MRPGSDPTGLCFFLGNLADPCTSRLRYRNGSPTPAAQAADAVDRPAPLRLDSTTRVRIVFLICPVCRIVVTSVREEGVSNTYRVMDAPCPRCQNAPPKVVEWVKMDQGSWMAVQGNEDLWVISEKGWELLI